MEILTIGAQGRLTRIDAAMRKYSLGIVLGALALGALIGGALTVFVIYRLTFWLD